MILAAGVFTWFHLTDGGFAPNSWAKAGTIAVNKKNDRRDKRIFKQLRFKYTVKFNSDNSGSALQACDYFGSNPDNCGIVVIFWTQIFGDLPEKHAFHHCWLISTRRLTALESPLLIVSIFILGV